MVSSKVNAIISEAVLTPELKEKEQKIRAWRKEASRMAALANKRLNRLEKAGLHDSPAYKRWKEDGGARFSVKGKSHNELQKEFARMDRFIKAETSTVRGVNKTLKEMAKNTGIKYKNLKELRSKATKFFELASKVEQYLRTVNDMASAIGYQKIWSAINNYTQSSKGKIDLAEMDVDEALDSVTKALTEFEEVEDVDANEFGAIGWFKLT